MNARIFREELMERLSPTHGEAESEAIQRVIVDHLKRTDKITSNTETNWPEPTAERARWILSKLLQGHPLQYVLQKSWFDGVAFYVNESVLIPRPETEELLDWIKKDHQHQTSPKQILDIGTGSGILAISLKKAFPTAEVTAIDVSSSALQVAQKNAAHLQADLRFIELDFMLADRKEELPVFDLIISNPPYIALSEKETMAAHVLEHEPWEALFVPDEDPLCFYRSIAEFGSDHVSPGGKIYVEVHEDRAEATRQIFDTMGYDTEIRLDMQGKKRMIRASKAS